MDNKDDSKKKPIRGNLLRRISLKKYVEDENLEDSPARLFRRIVNMLEMNPFKWNGYLTRYLDWMVTTKDPEKAKNERQTRTGNIKETYFQKPTLTMNKFLEGLSILEFEECIIDITARDIHGNIIRVQDTVNLVTKGRKEKIEKALAEELEKKE